MLITPKVALFEAAWALENASGRRIKPIAVTKMKMVPKEIVAMIRILAITVTLNDFSLLREF